jgi:hypothetical protein
MNAQPNAEEMRYANEAHTPAVAAQVQHQTLASQNQAMRASVNHGSPAIAATSRPGAFTAARGVGPAMATNNRPAPRSAGNSAAFQANSAARGPAARTASVQQSSLAPRNNSAPHPGPAVNARPAPAPHVNAAPHTNAPHNASSHSGAMNFRSAPAHVNTAPHMYASASHAAPHPTAAHAGGAQRH